MARQFSTVIEFIQYGKVNSNTFGAGVIEFEGFNSIGDGGATLWQREGTTGLTPSKTPTEFDDNRFTDAVGDLWVLVPSQIVTFNGVQFLPIPFGAAGNGGYYFNGTDFVFLANAADEAAAAAQSAADATAAAQRAEDAAASIEGQITTTQLINSNLSSLSVGDTIETNGFTTAGDGGGAQWLLTSNTNTPSQSPSQLGDAKLTDSGGREWSLVEHPSYLNLNTLGGDVVKECLNNYGGFTIDSDVVLTSPLRALNVSGSFKFKVKAGVKISASESFPNNKMIQISCLPECEKAVFYGGIFDAANIPNSELGEANDVIYMTGAKYIEVAFTNIAANGGTDSLIFTADYDKCYIHHNVLDGAIDAAIYTSAPSDGSGRGSCNVSDNYITNSQVASTGKRGLSSITYTGNTVEDCVNGLHTSEADGLKCADRFVAIGNTITRTQNPIGVRLALSGVIAGNEIYETGSDGSTQANAILIAGCSGVNVGVNTVTGFHPLATVNANYNGVSLTSRDYDGETYYSNNNTVSGLKVSDFGRILAESAGGQDNNTFHNNTGDSLISGAEIVINGPNSINTGSNFNSSYEVRDNVGRIFGVVETSNNNETWFTTRVMDGGSAVNKRVSQGAVDSGGTGFRVLRVPN